MAEKKTTSSKKRATKAEEVPIEVSVTEEAPVVTNNELEQVKNENEALTAMLKQMQEQIAELQKQQSNKKEESSQVVIKQNGDLTRTIKVVSMIPNVYNLSTQPYGKGKLYQFMKFGDSHMIKFNDMQDILALYLEQFEKGYAVLTSKADYEDLGIGYIYDEVLSKEKVEELITLKRDDAIDTILNMDEDMAEKIIGVIANKIVDGYQYDYNKIKKLEDEGFQINELVELLEASRQKITE